MEELNSPGWSRWLPRWLFIGVCLLAAAQIVCSTSLWDRSLQSFDKAVQPASVPSVGANPSQRFFLDNDAYYWISYAREMARTGQWRIRHTDIDNVPFGREVHWSQSISWLLVSSGYGRHWATGEPMDEAIEGASIWTNSTWLFLSMLGLGYVVYRRMGALPAAFFAWTYVTMPDILWTLHPFRPDHHGLHVAFSQGAIMCLVLGGLGWVKGDAPQLEESEGRFTARLFRPLEMPDAKQARRYFAAAGILTGLGLWTGATVQFFSIGAIAVASVLLCLFMPSSGRGERTNYVPELWRVWAAWGAIVGTVFYLIEYFPAHMTMRLEVNHPLYALSVVCVGELMVQLTRWRLGTPATGRARWFKVALAAAGVILVPALITMGPATWHLMRDAQMMRLHQNIAEFSAFSVGKESPLESWFRANGVLPLFLVGALMLSGSRRTTLFEWAALWVSFSVCFFFLVLTWWQVRWTCHYAAMSVWLMIVAGQIAWRNALASRDRKSWIVVSLISLVVLLQGVVFAFREYSGASAIGSRRVLVKELVDAVMEKHLAQGLRAATENQQVRVICEPGLAPPLYYFGGIHAVTSYYWENLGGLHSATAFMTDRDGDVALDIAKKRGLTHVLVSSDERKPVIFNYIQTGNASASAAQSTLLAKLYGSSPLIPSWIEPDLELTKIGQRAYSFNGVSNTVSLGRNVKVFLLRPGGGVR